MSYPSGRLKTFRYSAAKLPFGNIRSLHKDNKIEFSLACTMDSVSFWYDYLWSVHLKTHFKLLISLDKILLCHLWYRDCVLFCCGAPFARDNDALPAWVLRVPRDRTGGTIGERFESMECPRCKGRMVADLFEDLEDDTGAMSFKGWRCLVCGEILDPVIAANRASRPSPLWGRARRKFAPQLS